jgi:hypothetical protein
MPKPNATMYGVCRSELIIYEVLASDELKFKHDSSKVGRIIDGGSMITKEVIKELEWALLAYAYYF